MAAAQARLRSRGVVRRHASRAPPAAAGPSARPSSDGRVFQRRCAAHLSPADRAFSRLAHSLAPFLVVLSWQCSDQSVFRRLESGSSSVSCVRAVLKNCSCGVAAPFLSLRSRRFGYRTRCRHVRQPSCYTSCGSDRVAGVEHVLHPRRRPHQARRGSVRVGCTPAVPGAKLDELKYFLLLLYATLIS